MRDSLYGFDEIVSFSPIVLLALGIITLIAFILMKKYEKNRS